MMREILGIAGLGIVAALAVIPMEYDRDAWKHWTDHDRNCLDTRQEVLLEEAESVAMEGDCKVIIGKWTDPYSGETLFDPAYMDVDHMVPLKEAWLSGGWAWTPEKREQYANDLSHPDHLVATHRTWNRRKGAKAPHEWLPPNESFRCQYVSSWLEIKRRWELRMTVEEAEFVIDFLRRC